jgi:hypothetical protein
MWIEERDDPQRGRANRNADFPNRAPELATNRHPVELSTMNSILSSIKNFTGTLTNIGRKSEAEAARLRASADAAEAQLASDKLLAGQLDSRKEFLANLHVAYAETVSSLSKEAVEKKLREDLFSAGAALISPAGRQPLPREIFEDSLVLSLARDGLLEGASAVVQHHEDELRQFIEANRAGLERIGAI